MLGLVFAAWEKYISESFGATALEVHRKAVGSTVDSTPLANRVYDDEALVQGLSTVSRLLNIPSDHLLRQFGRYYINYGLTRHHCAYLLSQTNCARDLVLTMRQAHIQMAVGPDGLTPPVFTYKFLTEDKNQMFITYASPRHFCGWLWGAIEGAADRFGEKVYVAERTCIKRGASQCVFEVRFDPNAALKQASLRTPEQEVRWNAQQRLISLVGAVLPDKEPGLTLFEVQAQLRNMNGDSRQLRPALLLEAMQMLQHAGLLASTANRRDDNLDNRRYWRVAVVGDTSPNLLDEMG